MTSDEQNSGGRDRAIKAATLDADLQAPINQIVSMADILANTDLDAQQRTFVSMISRSARALSSTVSDMVDLSLYEEGALDISLAEFNVSELLDELETIFAAQAHDKSIEFSFDIQRDLPRTLLGDSQRLRQILSNMLRYAFKFTERGPVRFCVSGQAQDGQADLTFSVEGAHTDISFADNAISNVLIAIMGGSISHNAGVSDTSKTVLELSFMTEQHSAGAHAAPAELQGVRVLFLAEDTPENRAMTAELNQRGLDACLVGDGMIANIFMQAAGKICAKVDIVLSELALHQNYVREAGAEDALASYPKAQIIHIATGEALADADFAALQGYGACLTQPVNCDDIIAVISDILTGTETLNQQAEVSLLDAPDAAPIEPQENARMIIEPPPLAPSHEKLCAPFDDDDADLLKFDTVSFELVFDEDIAKDALETSSEVAPEASLEALPEEQLETSEDIIEAEDQTEADALFEAPFESFVDVLVAEDNEINQLVYSQILSKMDVTYQIVDSASVFLKEFKALNPRLVLLDISLPDADGFEVARQLRDSGLPWGINVPMIGVVAPSEGQDHDACIEARMDDCLAKPISPNSLTEKIAYWLERSANQSVA